MHHLRPPHLDSTDLCVVEEVYTNGWVKVTYPVSSGTVTRYAPASIFLNTDYSSVRAATATGLAPAYRRSNLENVSGNVYSGDACTIVGESGDYYCVICPWGTSDVTTGKYMCWIAKSAFSSLPELPVIKIRKTSWREDENVVFSWNKCSGADCYSPMVYDASGNRVAVCWGTSDLQFIASLKPGTYYVQVGSVNTTTDQVNYGARVEILARHLAGWAGYETLPVTE